MSTSDEARKRQQLYAEVSDRVTRGVLAFAKIIEPDFTGAEIGEIFLGCGLGLLAQDLGPAAAVERLREIAAELEATAVNPDPAGQTN